MKIRRPLKTIWVIWITISLLLPSSVLQANSGGSATANAVPRVADVELETGGRLQGVVVDVQGIPLAQIRVVVWQGQHEIAAAVSDRLGQFAVQGLRGGTYELLVGQQSTLIRAWTAQAAPPQAKPIALIVVGDQVVRGQLPMEKFFASDTFVIAGLVAAVIAIPIVVHNSDSSSPQSP